ncbi:hypothetical protein [Gimesia fumaroli]|uniref:Patatin-like phospholipase n=1 Tax=Gimesia fumaroli TaxID=2527976 RepID=A0A518IGL8_9PLAN|nr:hypothetical protein [Gimesia fumaroli]QDV52205.1 Patatin-like phospholipase [Gimesia fumaroli]
MEKQDQTQQSFYYKAELFVWRHLFLLVASTVSIIVALLVPQVTNISFYAPRPFFDRTFFVSSIALFVFLNITMIINFVNPQVPLLNMVGLGFLRKILFAPAKWMSRLLAGMTHGTGWFKSTSTRFVVSIIIMIIGVIGTYVIEYNLHTPYLLVGGFLKMLALWLAVVGIWLLFGAFFEIRVFSKEELKQEHLSDAHLHFKVWRKCGEVLSWLLITNLILEIMWVLPSLKWGMKSFRIYAIFATIQVLCTFIVLAGLMDYLQYPDGKKRSKYPVRFLAILAVILVMWSQSGDNISDPVNSISGSAETMEVSDQEKSVNINNSWSVALEDRLDAMPEGPVVIVAASGGGSRAAIFTSLIFQMLAEEEMTIPRVSEPIAKNTEISTKSVDDNKSKWTDHILLISSVSGGALATGHLLGDGNKQPLSTQKSDQLSSSSYDLLTRTEEKILTWMKQDKTKDECGKFQKADDKAEPMSAEEKKKFELVKKVLSRIKSQALMDDSKHEADTWNKKGDTAEKITERVLLQIAERSFQSQYVDKMNMNFMAPLLRGFLTPFVSRGEGLYYFWEYQFEWEDHRQLKKYSKKNPLLLVNTTDLDTGRRVIVGFPSIPQGFLLDSPTHGLTADDYSGETLIPSDEMKHAPVCIADYAGDSKLDLSLTRAVRLSANFPWGFDSSVISAESIPQLKMHKHAPPVRGIAERTKLRLLDGGVVDNTGVDSLYAVITALRDAAMKAPSGRESRVLENIRKRGVVILEIDSGAKPAGNNQTLDQFGFFTLPITGLNNAVYTNALQKRDELITKISAILSYPPHANILAGIKRNQVISSPQVTTKEDPKKEELVLPVTALLPLLDASYNPLDKERITVIHHRFKCNRINDTEADVITGFALGPDDKATVLALFLYEVISWRTFQKELKTQFEYYNLINKKEVSRRDAGSITQVKNSLSKLSTFYRDHLNQLKKLSSENLVNKKLICSLEHRLSYLENALAELDDSSIQNSKNEMSDSNDVFVAPADAQLKILLDLPTEKEPQDGRGKYLVLKENQKNNMMQPQLEVELNQIRQSKMNIDKMNQSRDRMYRSLSKKK